MGSHSPMCLNYDHKDSLGKQPDLNIAMNPGVETKSLFLVKRCLWIPFNKKSPVGAYKYSLGVYNITTMFINASAMFIKN